MRYKTIVTPRTTVTLSNSVPGVAGSDALRRGSDILATVFMLMAAMAAGLVAD